ncbi:STAS domain-containing protein [Actinoplanes aureus]|jgi:anti-anti-sigma factor|uniref:Anti-sigma factor antagonist n=1 Tax=Actinoplanes aureus TaxID=2792083 RepID=A0A931C9X6_9ACTN|nr:STAS domain-containing protein [Actinoplanes aureus]MBG0561010.1 STAS domain-containing protein [Actinoplanes aureus]
MATFEARTSAEPGRIIVTLAGECDLSAREHLTAVLLDALTRANAVFVDAAALTFLDSSGVHSLITAHHAAKNQGARVYVVNATGPVAAVLELTGLDTLLRAPTEERRHA